MKDQRQPTAADQIERMFGRRLRELRDERGLSQAKLSDELARGGLPMDSLAILRIEKNADGASGRRVRLGEAAAIARVLGVRLDEMIRRTVPLEEELAAARSALARAEHDVVTTRRATVEATARLEAIRERVTALESAISQDEETYSQGDKISAAHKEIQARKRSLTDYLTYLHEQEQDLEVELSGRDPKTEAYTVRDRKGKLEYIQDRIRSSSAELRFLEAEQESLEVRRHEFTGDRKPEAD